MYRFLIAIAVITTVILFTGLGSGVYAQPAAAQVDTQKRIENLEKQVAELMRIVKVQGKALQEARAEQEKFVSREKFNAARANMLNDAAGRSTKPKGFDLWSTVDVQLYGKIKFDAVARNSVVTGSST